MKRKALLYSLLASGCVLVLILYVQFRPNSFPYTLETEHFTFYYTDSDKGSIPQIRKQLEDNYARIVEELAPSAMPKIRVQIYPDLASFHKGIDRPESPDTVVGNAWKDEMNIVSPNNPGPVHSHDSIMKVVVHEFTHCVTLNLTEYPSFPSMNWLYESIAVYEADQFRNPQELPGIVRGHYPTLKELNDTYASPNVYDVGYTIIEYIRDTWGMGAVRDLVTSSGNLPAVLKKNAEEFEEDWYAYVQEKYLKTK